MKNLTIGSSLVRAIDGEKDRKNRLDRQLWQMSIMQSIVYHELHHRWNETCNTYFTLGMIVLFGSVKRILHYSFSQTLTPSFPFVINYDWTFRRMGAAKGLACQRSWLDSLLFRSESIMLKSTIIIYKLCVWKKFISFLCTIPFSHAWLPGFESWCG